LEGVRGWAKKRLCCLLGKGGRIKKTKAYPLALKEKVFASPDEQRNRDFIELAEGQPMHSVA